MLTLTHEQMAKMPPDSLGWVILDTVMPIEAGREFAPLGGWTRAEVPSAAREAIGDLPMSGYADPSGTIHLTVADGVDGALEMRIDGQGWALETLDRWSDGWETAESVARIRAQRREETAKRAVRQAEEEAAAERRAATIAALTEPEEDRLLRGRVLEFDWISEVIERPDSMLSRIDALRSRGWDQWRDVAASDAPATAMVQKVVDGNMYKAALQHEQLKGRVEREKTALPEYAIGHGLRMAMGLCGHRDLHPSEYASNFGAWKPDYEDFGVMTLEERVATIERTFAAEEEHYKIGWRLRHVLDVLGFDHRYAEGAEKSDRWYTSDSYRFDNLIIWRQKAGWRVARTWREGEVRHSIHDIAKGVSDDDLPHILRKAVADHPTSEADARHN